MSDDLVKQSIAELQDLVRCRCHEAFKGRGLHDPNCHCDSAEAVKVVADHVEALLKAEREKALRVKPLEWLGGKTHGSMYDYRIYGVRRGSADGFSSVFLERDQWGSRVQIAKCIPEETAKAAAQADYEARILDMIEGDVLPKAKKPNLVGTGVQVGLLKKNPAD